MSGLRAAEQKGKPEGKLEDARKMKAQGLAMDMIARITGLSVDEVNALKIL